MATLEELRKQAARTWPTGGRLLLLYSKEMLEEALATGKMTWQNAEGVTAEKARRKGGAMETEEHSGKGGKFLRMEQLVMGKERKVYACASCGAEIFWTKEASGFASRNMSDYNFHSCAASPVTPDPVSKPEVTTPPARADKPAAAAGTMITNALEALLQATSGNVDADQVRAIVQEEIARATLPTVQHLKINDLPEVRITGQHEQFSTLYTLLAARIPVLLVGPAGSGKTTAAHKAAEELGLQFHMISCGPLPQDGKLLGYMDANGKYVSTPLRECFENGGVFLFDEMDAAHPGTLVTLNALLANSCVTWPDGKTIARHADFVPMAAANTFGTGADRQYVGRNQLDAATLDRFFTIEWAYDWHFVEKLMPSVTGVTKSGYTSVTWLLRVKKISDTISKKGIRHVVGPRAALNGVKLLNAMDRRTLEEGILWKGTDRMVRQQIEESIR